MAATRDRSPSDSTTTSDPPIAEEDHDERDNPIGEVVEDISIRKIEKAAGMALLSRPKGRGFCRLGPNLGKSEEAIEAEPTINEPDLIAHIQGARP
jgi:hypothetical protein